jgi:hypothetical protein
MQNTKYEPGSFRNIKITFPNGEYTGEFKNCKRDGKGKLTYTNGDIYEGEFKYGKPHGKGKCTDTNGDICEREYKNGSIIGVTYTDQKKTNKAMLSYNWFAKSDDNQNKSSLKGPLLSYNQSQRQGDRTRTSHNNDMCQLF